MGRQLADPYGERTPDWAQTHGQRIAREIRDHHQRGGDPPSAGSDSGLAWALTMRALPYIALLAVAYYWMEVLTHYAEPYRAVLIAVLPDGWFVGGTTVEPQPWAVAGVALGFIAVVIIGLLMMRRKIGNAWARGNAGTALAWLALFPVSVVLVLILAMTPGLFFLAGAVATGDAFLGGPVAGHALRSWPLTLTVLVALWWSIGTTRRAVRGAARRRYAGYWQAPGGLWYPPDEQWVAPMEDPSPNSGPGHQHPFPPEVEYR